MSDLREYRKMRYMGDCKCDNCQLIPLTVIDEQIARHDALVKALAQIAAMDPFGVRADDLGRAARTAREALSQPDGCVGRSRHD